MKAILAIIIIFLCLLNIKSMAQSEYIIQIDLEHSNNAVWREITDFKSYPSWNSMLSMEANDQLLIGEKFQVSIIKENGKISKFKARTLSVTPNQSFEARQTILEKWMFSATHHFIVEDIDNNRCTFIQKWELSGILSKLLRKQIFAQLELFNQMNEDLKNHLEKTKRL